MALRSNHASYGGTTSQDWATHCKTAFRMNTWKRLGVVDDEHVVGAWVPPCADSGGSVNTKTAE